MRPRRLQRLVRRAFAGEELTHPLDAPPASDTGRRWWAGMNPANSDPYIAPRTNPRMTEAVP